jgi:A/G-specific adenine glycosylase
MVRDGDRDILEVVDAGATDGNLRPRSRTFRFFFRDFFSIAMASKLAVRLIDWYEKNKRDLPWRRTRDPYRIWLSEIMLQQTRVAAVIPYYERFLKRFPDFESLAAAPEAELLAMWAGLGYYSRARNLQKAARQMAAMGGFPRDYAGIRALPGVGDYTAAAVGSIAFGLPVAVLDGNVVRVMARVDCESGDVANGAARARLRESVQNQIDRHRPAEYNQALMELGATICLPRSPKCLICPINDICCARGRGIENSLPIKIKKQVGIEEEKRVLLIVRQGKLLLWRREETSRRLAGFWEAPEASELPGAEPGALLGSFRHAIVNHRYEVFVHTGKLKGKAPGLYQWFSWSELGGLPLSTIARKSLKLMEPGPRPGED